jgi:hypothetical protein
MINHHSVVHQIDLLAPIKPNLVFRIIPRFVDFNQHAINQSNATLELGYGGTQHMFFLYHGPSNIMNKCIIDAMKIASSQTTFFDQLV